jgi:uncharacterized protein (TIGR02217 family)
MSSTYPYLPMRWLVTTPDLADDPDVFPRLPGQGFLVEKTPVWSTTVRVAASGRQVRASQVSTPTWRFKVAYEVLRDRPSQAELQRLYGFFNTRCGQLGSFYYYDPGDNAVAGQPVATADGVTTTFQLVRTVDAGGVSPFTEPVYVLNGAPSVLVNGQPATGWSVGDYGQVSFSTPPAENAAISWSGSFLYWCRFSQDTLSPAQQVQSLWSLDGLQFESVKP